MQSVLRFMLAGFMVIGLTACRGMYSHPVGTMPQRDPTPTAIGTEQQVPPPVTAPVGTAPPPGMEGTIPAPDAKRGEPEVEVTVGTVSRPEPDPKLQKKKKTNKASKRPETMEGIEADADPQKPEPSRVGTRNYVKPQDANGKNQNRYGDAPNP